MAQYGEQLYIHGPLDLARSALDSCALIPPCVSLYIYVCLAFFASSLGPPYEKKIAIDRARVRGRPSRNAAAPIACARERVCIVTHTRSAIVSHTHSRSLSQPLFLLLRASVVVVFLRGPRIRDEILDKIDGERERGRERSAGSAASRSFSRSRAFVPRSRAILVQQRSLSPPPPSVHL